MYSRLTVLLLATVIAHCSVSRAQDTGQEDRNMIRVKYSKSLDVPDGVAFVSTLQMLKFASSDDSDTGRQWIEQSMGLEPDAAENLLLKMLLALERIDKQFVAFVRKTACNGSVAKVYGDQAFEAFERIDDEHDNLAARQLNAFKREIGDEQAARLQTWLDDRKLSTTHVKFNHKVRYEADGESVDARTADICVNWNRMPKE